MTFPISEASTAYVSRRLDRNLKPYYLVMLRQDSATSMVHRSAGRCEFEADAQFLVELINALLNDKPKETR